MFKSSGVAIALAYGVVNILGVTLAACTEPTDVRTGEPNAAEDGKNCAFAAEGCPCVAGAESSCGIQQGEIDGTSTCVLGVRKCSGDGVFSSCAPVTPRVTRLVSRGLSLAGVPPTSSCGTPCDPRCIRYVDAPANLYDAGTLDDGGVTVRDGSVELSGVPNGVPVSCTLNVAPVTRVVPLFIQVTGITPASNPPTVSSFGAGALGNGIDFRAYRDCSGVQTPVTVLWRTDAEEESNLTADFGTTTTLNVVRPYARTIKLSAVSGVLATSILVGVTVKLPTARPSASDTATKATASSSFDSYTMRSSDFLMYPFENTVFPLELAPPTVQWKKGETTKRAARIKLKFTPTAASTATFEWEAIFQEPTKGRAISETDDATAFASDSTLPLAGCGKTDGTITGSESYSKTLGGTEACSTAVVNAKRLSATNFIPKEVWDALGQSSRPRFVAGTSTNTGTTTLELVRETSGGHDGRSINLKFADAALPASLFTTAYSKVLGVNRNVGGVVQIDDGYTDKPKVSKEVYLVKSDLRTGASNSNLFGYKGYGQCTTCHSISSDGHVFLSALDSGAPGQGIATISKSGVLATPSANVDVLLTPVRAGTHNATTHTMTYDRAYQRLASDSSVTFASQLVTTEGTESLQMSDETRPNGWAALTPKGHYFLTAVSPWGNTTGASGGEGLPGSCAATPGTDARTATGSWNDTNSNCTSARGVLYGRWGVAGRNRWDRTLMRLAKVCLDAAGENLAPSSCSGMNTQFQSPGTTNQGLGDVAMMTPVFSPDGTKFVYVTGDNYTDHATTTTYSATTGWRRGLAFFNVSLAANESTPPTFSSPTLAFSTYNSAERSWPGSATGATYPELMWPSFEPDSRSVLVQAVEANPGFAGSAFNVSDSSVAADNAYSGQDCLSVFTDLKNTRDARLFGFPLLDLNKSVNDVYSSLKSGAAGWCSNARDYSVDAKTAGWLDVRSGYGDFWRGFRWNAWGGVAPTLGARQFGKNRSSIRSVDLASTSTATDLTRTSRLTKMSDGHSGFTDDDGSAQAPSALSISAGGYRWVAHLSNRPYGNMANCGANIARECSSNLRYAARSYVWISAVDDTVSATTDRSHPGFFAPGQSISKDSEVSGTTVLGRVYYSCSGACFSYERPFLVRERCRDPLAYTAGGTAAASCQSDQECCTGGTCVLDTLGAGYCRAPKGGACVANNAPGCSVDNDCCPSGTGEIMACQAGTCKTASCAGSTFTPASFERDYQATCSTGSRVTWKTFSANVGNVGGSSIKVYIRSADTAAGLLTATEQLVDTYTTSGVSSSSLIPPLPGSAGHRVWTKVRLQLVPSTSGCESPAISQWGPQWTCTDSE